MFKKIGLLLIVITLLVCSIGWAEENMELTAPGGGEMDLAQNLTKYFGTTTMPVEVRWNNTVLDAYYLEYNRAHQIFKGQDRVKLEQTAPVDRILKSGMITVEVNRDYFLANQAVNLQYDEFTNINGEILEWDRKNDSLKVNGKPAINYKDWIISGDHMEGKMTPGLFTVYGPATASNGENSAHAGKMIFDRQQVKIFMQENPVFTRGKNEMTATEIIYDLKTKKLSANGPVKSRIVEENR